MYKSLNISRANLPFKEELSISIPFALLSAHIFVAFRMKQNCLQLLLRKGYLSGLLITACVAFSMIVIVKMATRQLDKTYPWDRVMWRRLFAQFLYGYLLTLLLEFLVSYAYFSGFGINRSDSAYFDFYGLTIAMYILLLNLYYNSGFKEKTVMKTKTAEGSSSTDLTVKQPKNAASDKIAQDSIEHAVVFISISGKHHYAKSANGEFVMWDYTISESIEALPANSFFQISRSCIVHRSIVKTLEIDPLKHKLTVILKTPFKEQIDVSALKQPEFKKWYYQK